MYCSKCGAVVAEGVAYCGACGQPSPGIAVAPVVAPIGIPMNAQVAARAPVVYAGFWLRLVALIIDAIVLGIVGTIITLPFMASIGMRGIFGGPVMRPEDIFPLMGLFIRIALIRFALAWLYYALLESSSWQATLGKKALGLEVTDMEGHRIGFGRASGRFFGKIVSAFILYIGFIMAGFTQKKQALHDMMAGCLVIKKT